VGDPDHPVRFAVSELSNGVWGFYVPTEPLIESRGSSTDGSLRYEYRLGELVDGRHDSIGRRAVLIDSANGQVLVDCAAWTSSRITKANDGSLFLHLQQNAFDSLFRIDSVKRLFCNHGEAGVWQPLSSLALAVEQARHASDRRNALPTLRHISPDGTIRVDLAVLEWSNSHWVNSPRVIEIASGRVVLDLWATHWDATVWFPDKQCVRLGFQRYQHGRSLTAEIDLARGTYQIFSGANPEDALPEAPLAGIASALQAFSCHVAQATAPITGANVSSNAGNPSHAWAAWRTALLILAGALVAIAVATFATLHSDPYGEQTLDTIPTMPD
jgi:hypothetical protein